MNILHVCMLKNTQFFSEFMDHLTETGSNEVNFILSATFVEFRRTIAVWLPFHSQLRNDFERLKELAVMYVFAIKNIALNREEQKIDDAISRHSRLLMLSRGRESPKLNGGINKWPAVDYEGFFE